MTRPSITATAPPHDGLGREARELDVCRRALSLFELPSATQITTIRIGENGVFRLTTPAGIRYALRVHRTGYRSPTQLQSEFAWMDRVHRAGIPVPRPLLGMNGDIVQQVVDGCGAVRDVDVLSWLEGPLLETLPPREGLPLLGRALAEMHCLAQDWAAGRSLDRLVWDVPGLIGPQALLGDYRAAPLSAEDRHLFDRAAEEVAHQLDAFGKKADRYGVIHGDLLEGNALLVEDRCALIDFDDYGYGWHLFDIATIRYRGSGVLDEPGWLPLVLDAYRDVRELPEDHLAFLPAMQAARALAFVGWFPGRGAFAEPHRERILARARQRSAGVLDAHGRSASVRAVRP